VVGKVAHYRLGVVYEVGSRLSSGTLIDNLGEKISIIHTAGLDNKLSWAGTLETYISFILHAWRGRGAAPVQ
jgi:hypothetical protein